MRNMIARLLQTGKEKHGMTCLQNEKHLRHNQKHISQRCGQRRSHTLPMVQIRIALFLTLSLCLFSGCQKPPQLYGNFAGVDSADLVKDAAGAVHAAYPPAKTRLVPLHPVEDAFGLCLVDSLRNAGYAVAEYAPPEKGGKPLVDAETGLGFAYTIEALHDGGGLRLTLHVGDGALSRMYRIKRSGDTQSYIPRGFWTRRQ